MENNKDKSERLKYLKEELEKQKEKLNLHKQLIEKLMGSSNFQIKEIKYNKGWIDFHRNSIEKHKKQIKEAKTPKEIIDQEIKLKFHIEQIEKHHTEYLNYHQKELEHNKKWIGSHEETLLECGNQIEFLKKRIEENMIAEPKQKEV